jgi:hypothetical protein
MRPIYREQAFRAQSYMPDTYRPIFLEEEECSPAEEVDEVLGAEDRREENLSNEVLRKHFWGSLHGRILVALVVCVPVTTLIFSFLMGPLSWLVVVSEHLLEPPIYPIKHCQSVRPAYTDPCVALTSRGLGIRLARGFLAYAPTASSSSDRTPPRLPAPLARPAAERDDSSVAVWNHHGGRGMLVVHHRHHFRALFVRSVFGTVLARLGTRLSAVRLSDEQLRGLLRSV